MKTQRRMRVSVVLGAVSAVMLACAPAPPIPPTGNSPVADVVSLTDQGTPIASDANSGAVDASGRFSVFTSLADNIVAADTDGSYDLFLRDNDTNEVELVADGFSQNPTISENGRYVGFTVGGTPAFYDQETKSTNTISDATLQGIVPIINDDGTYAVFLRSSNFGLFTPVCGRYDIATQAFTDCPATPNQMYAQSNGISSNARYVSYSAYGDGNPSTTHMWDLVNNTVQPYVGGPSPFFFGMAVSNDGNLIAGVTSDQANETTSAQVYNIYTQAETNLGISTSGWFAPTDISPNNRYVALISNDNDNDPADTNTTGDVYVWDTAAGTVNVVVNPSTSQSPPEGSSVCTGPSRRFIGNNSLCVATSAALTPTDTNGVRDIYSYTF